MESISGWINVYEIAGKRHGTKQGRKPLSEHAYAILEALAERESLEIAASTLGRFFL